MDKTYDRQPTFRSRELRSNATPAERILWQHLRNRKLAGTRFNRQVPIGPFICDFVARGPKLIVELDGGQHAGATDYDRRRSNFFESSGYVVIRFWNNDVLENIEGVVERIERILKDMPSPCPLPLAGGEEARSAEGEGL